MKLSRWREGHRLSLAAAATLFGIGSPGTISKIELGKMWVGPKLAERIYRITLGIGPMPVSLEDHFEAYRENHSQEFSVLHEQCRQAVKDHVQAALSPGGNPWQRS